MGEAWSRRLREAEEGEVKLTASAEKAHRALAKKEAEVKDLSSRLGDLERELDALRRRNTNEPVDANANADTNADPKTPAERKLRRVVAVDETPSPKKTVDDDGDEPKTARANGRVLVASTVVRRRRRRRRRRGLFFGDRGVRLRERRCGGGARGGTRGGDGDGAVRLADDGRSRPGGG